MMMQNNPLSSLLASLFTIYPPESVLLIGAGNGSSMFVELLMRNQVDYVTLVEPQDAAYRQLEAFIANTEFKKDKHWVLSNEVIAQQSGQVDFYYANKSSESGLVAPEDLTKIWPNLRLNQKVTLHALGLDALCSQTDPAPNWLMVDCLGALQIISNNNNFTNFDVIVLNVLFGFDEQINTYSDHSEIASVLNLKGFKEQLKHAGQHPNVGYVVFVRDYKSKSTNLSYELDSLQAKHEQSLAQHESAQLAWQETKSVNEKLALQQADKSAQQQTQIEQLQQQLGSLQAEHEQTLAQHESAQLAWQEAKGANEKLALQQADKSAQQQSQIQRLQQQLDSLIDLRRYIDSNLKAELLNVMQQLEAFFDIQSFFNNGELLPLMHGWPVSPDFSRYLIQLLKRNQYDLILEFGSGTSTVLIAKALAKLQSEGQDTGEVVQVAFEHLDEYYEQTIADLEGNSLAQSVRLKLAELQPYQAPNGNTYSYYACHDVLVDLSKMFRGTPTKILMVVDGPPSATGKHARYPCLPAVLAHFEIQHMDILLDDYSRNDEQEVGALWESDLLQLGYQVVSKKISMEKDALLISVSPQ